MTTTEKCSSLRGLTVVSREEGSILGTVSAVYVNSEMKQLAGLAFKPHRLGTPAFIAMSNVHQIGRDVVFVESEVSVSNPSACQDNDLDIRDLQGHWITSSEGTHIGHLSDMDFEPANWAIRALCLTDGSSLPVAASEVTLGRDEVLIPAGITANLRQAEHRRGILTRVFGAETTEQVSGSIQKAISKMRRRNGAEPAPQPS